MSVSTIVSSMEMDWFPAAEVARKLKPLVAGGEVSGALKSRPEEVLQ